MAKVKEACSIGLVTNLDKAVKELLYLFGSLLFFELIYVRRRIA